MKGGFSVFLLSVILSGCAAQGERKTIAELDRSGMANRTEVPVQSQVRSKQEIRKAYWKYLNHTDNSDTSRHIALSRLAQLEFEISNERSINSKSLEENGLNDSEKDQLSQELKQIRKSIELYQLSLKDYPNAKGNDRILYQLAKAQDQIGETEASFESLKILSLKYPKSNYYVEAQFRIAEHFFSRAQYDKAETAYTEVILSPNNFIFLEKALFKRGWTRFKQSYYDEAIEDFVATLTNHQFNEPEKLSKSEREQFDEYFRAIGLSFANQGGAEPLYEYFKSRQDFPYIFHTYSVISDIYLKQERYSDAVKMLDSYREHFSEDDNYPLSQLKVVQIWQQSGFKDNLFNAIENFYSNFNPKSNYWNRFSISTTKRKQANLALKKYILLTAEHFHAEYQKNKSDTNMRSTQIWYDRYLAHYEDFAQTDGVHFKYAELLRSNGDLNAAFTQYEKAAFDGDIVLDKDSAYQTIALGNILYYKSSGTNRNQILKKQLSYVPLFSHIYADDERTDDIIANAAQLAYENDNYMQTINIVSLPVKNISVENRFKIDVLKAQSHFRLMQYDAAESAYANLLSQTSLKANKRKEFNGRLALSIYQQGNSMKSNSRIDEAIYHYMRISDNVAETEIAATGVYDAIALMMQHEKWHQAVEAINRFQTLFPKHKFNREITKKLSVAFIKLERNDKAAEQFEKISDFEQDKEVKMAALWKAAELYDSQKDYPSATRAYSNFANTYKKPFGQNMEALHRLVELYSQSKNKELKAIWQNRIIKADRNASENEKTDRTKFIAAVTLISLGREQNNQFTNQKLTVPLNKSLRKKKSSMQKAVEHYGKASSYGISEITTESTYAIAKLYSDFSQALLNSERPKNLNEEELEQYNVLLEDQAYPFEDKAIEFYEVNLSRIKAGTFDDWVTLSFTELKRLFPTKYARKSKIDGFIKTLN